MAKTERGDSSVLPQIQIKIPFGHKIRYFRPHSPKCNPITEAKYTLPLLASLGVDLLLSIKRFLEEIQHHIFCQQLSPLVAV